MDMTTECRAAGGRHHAARGLQAVGHVVPARRRIGVGVHEQALPFLDEQGPRAQEGALCFVELSARPIDRCRSQRIHARARFEDGLVVIAEKRDRVFLDEARDRIDDEARIRAVADVVAEKNETLGTQTAGVIETGLERLAVSVDVREEGDQHDQSIARGRQRLSSNCRRPRNPDCFLVTVILRCGLVSHPEPALAISA
jgi:hypothetical protein